jgi:hypothetical protein
MRRGASTRRLAGEEDDDDDGDQLDKETQKDVKNQWKMYNDIRTGSKARVDDGLDEPGGAESAAGDEAADGASGSTASASKRLSMSRRKNQHRGRGKASESEAALERRRKIRDPAFKALFIEAYGEEEYWRVLSGVAPEQKSMRHNMSEKQLRDDLCTEPLEYVNMLGRMVYLGRNKLLMLCPLCKTQMGFSARSFGPFGISCGECTKKYKTELPRHVLDMARFPCSKCPARQSAHKWEDVVPELVLFDDVEGMAVFAVEYFCHLHYREKTANVPDTTLRSLLMEWMANKRKFRRVGDQLMSYLVQ